MPKNDPAGYLPSVKKARKAKGKAKVKKVAPAKGGRNPMQGAVPKY